MKLENEFTVPSDVDSVYRALGDPEKVTPCFPGATLDSVDGDDFTGTVKVKLGPVSMTYKGKGSFVERDAERHRVVVDAQGRDARGNGTASAKATLTMTDAGGSTKVTVSTEMQVTGRPAQFGRGVISDVGDKILGQFAQCLADELGSTGSSAGVSGTDTASSGGNGTAPAPSAVTGSAGPSAPTAVASGSAVSDSGAPAPIEMPTTVARAAKGTEGARPGASAPSVPPQPVPSQPVPSQPVPPQPVPASGAPAANGTTPSRPAQRQRVEEIDLLASSREALVKRMVPVGAGAGVLALLIAIIVVVRGRR